MDVVILYLSGVVRGISQPPARRSLACTPTPSEAPFSLRRNHLIPALNHEEARNPADPRPTGQRVL